MRCAGSNIHHPPPSIHRPSAPASLHPADGDPTPSFLLWAAKSFPFTLRTARWPLQGNLSIAWVNVSYLFHWGALPPDHPVSQPEASLKSASRPPGSGSNSYTCPGETLEGRLHGGWKADLFGGGGGCGAQPPPVKKKKVFLL
jgi:hypothetical protein